MANSNSNRKRSTDAIFKALKNDPKKLRAYLDLNHRENKTYITLDRKEDVHEYFASALVEEYPDIAMDFFPLPEDQLEIGVYKKKNAGDLNKLKKTIKELSTDVTVINPNTGAKFTMNLYEFKKIDAQQKGDV